MAQRSGVEAPARCSGGHAAAAASPEKALNCCVRSVALVERVGNALGTQAFTWATVVLLGGYPTVLRPADDFWFATTIVFLEAARYVRTHTFCICGNRYKILLTVYYKIF